jgi:hypothetical protein
MNAARSLYVAESPRTWAEFLAPLAKMLGAMFDVKIDLSDSEFWRPRSLIRKGWTSNAHRNLAYDKESSSITTLCFFIKLKNYHTLLRGFVYYDRKGKSAMRTACSTVEDTPKE